MKYGIVYIVMHEGKVEYASTDRQAAEEYAGAQMENGTVEVLNKWGNDDPTEKDISEAALQSGYEGDCYEVIEVDISNKTEDDEDDTVELPNGIEIEVSEISKKLATCK